MARGYPEPLDGGRPDQRAALLAESHMPRQVARLLRFDGRRTQHRTQNLDVRDDVVALSFIALHLIDRVWQWDRDVRFTWQEGMSICLPRFVLTRHNVHASLEFVAL